MSLRILHRNPRWVAVDKPAGFHVHPPEDRRHRIPGTLNCVRLLSDQLECPVFPVHRLDVATSGVLLFALDREMAGELQLQFVRRKARKTYYCVVRGWSRDWDEIDRPLRDAETGIEHEALTRYRTLARTEMRVPIGPFESARFSLLEVEPVSGRRHQIRRHLARLSHPIIGDRLYGDPKYDRLFRERLKLNQLLLKAQCLELEAPSLRLRSPWRGPWHRVFDFFGLCPWKAC